VLVAIIFFNDTATTEIYTILQILSLTLFDKTSLIQLLAEDDHTLEGDGRSNQLDLFDN
jgi:hypothetical protein